MENQNEHYEMINGEVYTPSELVGKTVYYMGKKMPVIRVGLFKGCVDLQGENTVHCDVHLKYLELIK